MDTRYFKWQFWIHIVELWYHVFTRTCSPDFGWFLCGYFLDVFTRRHCHCTGTIHGVTSTRFSGFSLCGRWGHVVIPDVCVFIFCVGTSFSTVELSTRSVGIGFIFTRDGIFFLIKRKLRILCSTFYNFPLLTR